MAERPYLTLEEAAKKLKSSLEDLFYWGSRNEITITVYLSQIRGKHWFLNEGVPETCTPENIQVKGHFKILPEDLSSLSSKSIYRPRYILTNPTCDPVLTATAKPSASTHDLYEITGKELFPGLSVKPISVPSETFEEYPVFEDPFPTISIAPHRELFLTGKFKRGITLENALEIPTSAFRITKDELSRFVTSQKRSRKRKGPNALDKVLTNILEEDFIFGGKIKEGEIMNQLRDPDHSHTIEEVHTNPPGITYYPKGNGLKPKTIVQETVMNRVRKLRIAHRKE